MPCRGFARRLRATRGLHAISRDGVRISYEVTGSGAAPPLILIPGGAGTGADWKSVAPALSEKRRVVTFDPRGMGASEAGVATVRNMAEDALAVLRAAGAHAEAPADARVPRGRLHTDAWTIPRRAGPRISRLTRFGRHPYRSALPAQVLGFSLGGLVAQELAAVARGVCF